MYNVVALLLLLIEILKVSMANFVSKHASNKRLYHNYGEYLEFVGRLSSLL